MMQQNLLIHHYYINQHYNLHFKEKHKYTGGRNMKLFYFSSNDYQLNN